MDPKKKRTKAESKQFLPEWNDLYCFMLPNHTGALKMCLICQKAVVLFKSSNIKRHYETCHKSFAKKFPLGKYPLLKNCKFICKLHIFNTDHVSFRLDRKNVVRLLYVFIGLMQAYETIHRSRHS